MWALCTSQTCTDAAYASPLWGWASLCLVGLTDPRGIAKPKREHLGSKDADNTSRPQSCSEAFLSAECVLIQKLCPCFLSPCTCCAQGLCACPRAALQKGSYQMPQSCYIYLTASWPLINQSQAANKSGCTVLCQQFACMCKLQTGDLDTKTLM